MADASINGARIGSKTQEEGMLTSKKPGCYLLLEALLTHFQ